MVKGEVMSARSRIIQRAAATGVAVSALMAGLALPAAALTDSGNTTCTAGATVGVVGEQQRFGDTLTVKVAGKILFQGANVYTVGRNSYLTGSQNWSGSSVSLLFSGTYGRCIPPNV